MVWPEIKTFAKLVFPNGKVLDVGCGNGRVFEVLKEKKVDYLGIDFSEGLVEEAKKRYPKAKFKVRDITKKETWRGFSNQFDFIFCLAVLHHLPSKKLRNEVIKKLRNSLKDNGRAFVTVWNLWQPKYLKHHFSLQSIKLKWQLKNVKVLYIPYKLSQGRGEPKRVNRFVYPFTLKELKKLFEENEFFPEESFSSVKNLCLVTKKKI